MDLHHLLTPLKKRPARHFSVEDKQRILNILKVCTEQNPDNNKTENIEFTAKTAVPLCDNNSLRTSNKIFIRVPENKEVRERWFNVNAINPLRRPRLSSNIFVCEDHFDLKNDCENWLKFKLVGCKLKVKKDVAPHKNLCENKVDESFSQVSPSTKKHINMKNEESSNTSPKKEKHKKNEAQNKSVSIRSVRNILREYKEEHTLKQPKVYSRKRTILDNISEETKCKIRRVVHSFQERNEPPTVKKILAAIHEDEELRFFKRTTLSVLLNEMGIRNSQQDNAAELSSSTRRNPKQFKSDVSTLHSHPATESVLQENTSHIEIKEKPLETDPLDCRLNQDHQDSIKKELNNSENSNESDQNNCDSEMIIDSISIKEEPIENVKIECSDNTKSEISVNHNIVKTEETPMFESVYVKEEPFEEDSHS